MQLQGTQPQQNLPPTAARCKPAPARCGAKAKAPPRKEVRRRLETAQREANEILRQLRAGAAAPSPRSLADVVAAIQRVGAEVEELAGAVDGMSSSSGSSSSSSSSSDEEDCAPAAVAALEAPPKPAAAPVEPRKPTAQLPATLAGLPAGAERLWAGTVAGLGAELRGQVLVCDGKACSRDGSDGVLAAFAAQTQAWQGLQVGACKCVGACKQGPNLRLVRPDGSRALVTSRDKPPKKPKQPKGQALGNIVTRPRQDVAVR